jgi:hypothetical protein
MLTDLLHAAAPTIALIAACMACDGGFPFRPAT